MKNTFKTDLKTLVSSPNIAELMSTEELNSVSQRVLREYQMDKESRELWEKRNDESMKLALQVVETKSFPWTNASNVKFPLITIAALQFHARAYAALIPGKDIVKCYIAGDDSTGALTQRATRIEDHMSWQILEKDVNWEDQMDKVLITTPIVGCAFKKTYYSAKIKSNVSEMVLARDLVVDYWTKSLETASRITHVLYMTRNDIVERVNRGLYLEVDLKQPIDKDPNPTRDKAQGVYAADDDPDTPYEVLEQHRWFDFDGDGYAEPYIVTVIKDNKKVVRIVANYFEENVEKVKGKIVQITPEQYFTKFSFIPSPDGGFYDLGFGSLLGPLNESINTLINQLIDTGTMAVTAGGFLGRGLKIKGGNQSFAPLEWKTVETTGDDIRKNVYPLPVREPSNVLFTLLNLLINYGERIGSSTDVMVGENLGQNTPAETTRNMVEQGMKIFAGIFKRVYRSLKQELRKQYRLNQLYLDEVVKFGSQEILHKDYLTPVEDVGPTCDPNVISDDQKIQQALSVLQAASTSPGYNLYEANRRYLEALKISNIEQILPDPNGPNAIPPSVDSKLQIEQMKQQTKQMEIQINARTAAIELMQQAELISAQIMKLQADATNALASAQTEDAYAQIAAINAQISAEKNHRDSLFKAAETMLKAIEIGKAEKESASDGAGVS